MDFYTKFGITGLRVSRIGLGAAQAGYASLEDQKAEKLLHGALDAGVNLIDSALGYDRSEERIGRFLHGRRTAFLLSTKVGYGIPGVPDWTRASVTAGIEQSLSRTRSEVIDIVHLHSCGPEILARGEVIDALEEAREQGKIRFCGYSGDNEGLEAAVASGRFQVFQASLNLCDQHGIPTLRRAAENGGGIIAKRPLANTAWRYPGLADDEYARPYWERLQAMQLDAGMPMEELALRFAVYHTGAHTAITGTSRPENLAANIRAAMLGPLPDDVVREIRSRYLTVGSGWKGEV